ncbi:hypothetical protein Q5752_003374 [Cryptotrichosporon argae]
MAKVGTTHEARHKFYSLMRAKVLSTPLLVARADDRAASPLATIGLAAFTVTASSTLRSQSASMLKDELVRLEHEHAEKDDRLEALARVEDDNERLARKLRQAGAESATRVALLQAKAARADAEQFAKELEDERGFLSRM